MPSVWLQQRLVDGSAHWYDAVAALVYVTHFVSIPLLTAIAWFCLRDRFLSWLVAVLTFTAIGVTGYVVYPAAPPWLASDRGVVGPVSRVSSLGWDYLHLDAVGRLVVAGQDGSNPVAAMPSLHAGSALLVALFLWPHVRAPARVALLAYPVLMGISLVYMGEHYVVDVVAGWLTAVAAMAVATLGPGAARRARGRLGAWRGRSRAGGGGARRHPPGSDPERGPMPKKKTLEAKVKRLRKRLARQEAETERWRDRARKHKRAAEKARAARPASPPDLAAVAATATPQESATVAPDEGWTVVQLRAEARARGLTGLSGKTKAELLDALR